MPTVPNYIQTAGEVSKDPTLESKVDDEIMWSNLNKFSLIALDNIVIGVLSSFLTSSEDLYGSLGHRLHLQDACP